MRYIKIKPEQTKFYSWLDPFGYLDHITLPGYFAIGQIEDDEEIEYLISGLMICVCTEDAIVIEWLCIDPDYESKERGEGFLLKAYEIAVSMDKPKLCALMSADMELGNVCNNSKSFFTERLFEKEEAMIGEWNALLSDVAKSKWLFGPGKLPETKSLGEVKKSSLSSFFENIPEDGDAYPASLMGEIDIKKADRRLSRVIVDDDEVCGILLIQKAEDGLWPVFLYSESENETKALIKGAYEEASAKLPADTDVWVRTRFEAVGNILEKVVPKKISDRYLLVASVSEYLSLKN